MPNAVRITLAVLAGLVSAVALVSLFEALGHQIIPPPKDVSFKTMDEARAAMQKISFGAFCFVFLAHAMGAFGGIVVAGLIAPGRPLLWTLVMGGLIFAGSVFNFFALHVPWHVGVPDFACVLFASWAGFRVLRTRVPF